MKTRRIVGYVFSAAFGCALACGSASSRPSPTSTADEGGVAEAGGDDSLVASDSRAGDEGDGASRGFFGKLAANGAMSAAPDAGPSQYCCVSGAYYACPDDAALSQCTGFDISGCLQSCPTTDTTCANTCGQMATATQTDPSRCTRDASKDALCTAAPDASSSSFGGATAPPPTPKNACGGYFLGIACSVGGQCNGDMHCTRNNCFPDDVGNPCTFPDDCGSANHCTAGCCASPQKGSACDTAIDCTSGNCSNGVCQ